MLPEALSNELCSLKSDVDRLCMVCDMSITASGDITAYRFYPAVMHSRARLTYTQVWDWLSQPAAGGESARRCCRICETCTRCTRCWPRRARSRGAIDFETIELELKFDPHGKIETIVPVVRNDAHKLIEECMLAANVCAAEYLLQAEAPRALSRARGTDTGEARRAQGISCRQRALPRRRRASRRPPITRSCLPQIKDRPDFNLLQTVLLRSLQQAVYSPDNDGHFGLGYDAYTHFTSPIRRYPDLLIHRCIKACLAGERYRPSGASWAELGVHCSLTERRADDATRDVENWLKCYFMQDRVGEVFTGTVSGVTHFGMFVTLDGLNIDGLVHVTELGNDYFHFDAVHHSLNGERSGKRFRLADRITVKVARVDLETTKIDFVLADADASSGGAKKKPRPTA